MNVSIPANADKRTEGAGQIRAVKNATKNSFPNIKGRVELTHTQMNNLYTATTEPLLAIAGEVRWIYNTVASIPVNWYLCDGTNGTPSLIDKFIMGGITHGATGGTSEVTIPAVIVGSTVLTEEQIPAHTHFYTEQNSIDVIDPSRDIDIRYIEDIGQDYGRDGSGNRGLYTTRGGGGGQGHTHTTNSPEIKISTLPPYITLLPIMYKPAEGDITPPPPPQIPLDVVLQPINQTLKYPDEPYTVSTSWHVPEEFIQHTENVEWILEEEAPDGSWIEVSKGTGEGMDGITHMVNPVTGAVKIKED